MRLYILGICGTFMGGLATIARQMGCSVSGCDRSLNPPMSDVLHAQGIQMTEGFDLDQFPDAVDCVVVGNAIRRGNPVLEYIIEQGISYTSGPQWLFEHVLYNKHVLAVSGTHGKTTTTSMLAWILSQAGYDPGFLIGGVANNFPTTARITESPWFVIEADEYDSAFFDKRSKFIHYRPKTLIINNLEFDHADIFKDLEAIQSQFQVLLKTCPSNGLVIYPDQTASIDAVIESGCWSETHTFGSDRADWSLQVLPNSQDTFDLQHNGIGYRIVSPLPGVHNMQNATAAMIAAHHIGISPSVSSASLETFKGVKRRMEWCGCVDGVVVYDDFAHHPTAIMASLAAARARCTSGRLIAVVEFASNTMKAGIHKTSDLVTSIQLADCTFLLASAPDHPAHAVSLCAANTTTMASIEAIVVAVCEYCLPGDHVMVMTNSSASGLSSKVVSALHARATV